MATALEDSGTFAARPSGTALRSGWLDRHAALVSLGLFATSLALVLPLLGRQSIWFDEAVTMSNVQLPYDLGRYLRADATPPLYPLLVHAWLQLFGTSLVAARALSVLASAASVVALFQLGRRFLDARTGLLAALLLLTSRCQIFFAHEARPYALVLLLAIASFHVLLLLLERVTWQRLVLLCLLDAALLYTHYVAAFALCAQTLAALPSRGRSPRAFLQILAAQLCAVALILPLALFIWTTLWPLPMAGWLPAPTWRGIPNELAKLTGSGLVLTLEAALVLAAAITAWLQRAGRTGAHACAAPRTVAVLALWSVVPLVAAFAVSAIEPVFLGRYLLYVTPGWYLLVALAATRLPVGRGLGTALIGALCALSLAGAWRSPLERADWRTTADRVRAATTDGALAVIVPAHEMLPFAWHFSPESFRDLDHLAPRLRDLGVVGVQRLADVTQLAALPRELVIVVPQPLGASADVLAPVLAAAGRAPWQREDVAHIVLLRSPAPASDAAPAS
ncbi:MAG: glycosyltransferase family 39 protein [Candidatus Binatia bacterium]